MGNHECKKDDNAEFLKAIRQMNRDMNDKSPSKVSTNLDQVRHITSRNIGIISLKHFIEVTFQSPIKKY